MEDIILALEHELEKNWDDRTWRELQEAKVEYNRVKIQEEMFYRQK